MKVKFISVDITHGSGVMKIDIVDLSSTTGSSNEMTYGIILSDTSAFYIGYLTSLSNITPS